MKSLIIFVTLVGLTSIKGEHLFIERGLDPMSDEMIKQITSLGTTWKVSFKPFIILCELD